MAQKYTEARKEGNRKWDAANLDRLSIALPKGSRETIKAHAAALGESVNGFIGRAISEAMERDGGRGPQEAAGGPPEAGTVSLPSDALKPAQEAAGLSGEAGSISLSPDTLEAAQAAAETTGEVPAAFVARAVQTQVERDKAFLKMGIDPATGDKLKREA